MTNVLITVDTELSALLHQRGLSAHENLASSIWGKCATGAFGIGWQMHQLETHGLKGVFFVDPLPALLYGTEIIRDIIDPIIGRGHEVQLHIHTEWLDWVPHSPVGERRGRDLADFCLEDQMTLLGIATDLIEQAGAPRPTAFRAGNYGANDNSLRALAKLGLIWDSSVNAPFLGAACKINAPPDHIGPMRLHAIVEVPVAGIHDRHGSIRPAQICALSAREMREALVHAADQAHFAFLIVTHSFEMLSRDRVRPNRIVMKRFEAMCQTIKESPDLMAVGFGDLDPDTATLSKANQLRLGPNRLRTGLRLAEQALANLRYERQLHPS